MKKFLITATAIAALLSINPAVVEACEGCKKSEKQVCKISKIKDKAKSLWMHKDALGLTEDQVNKLKTVKHGAIKKIIQLNAEVDVVKVDLKSAMWSEMIDTAAVNKLIAKKYAAKESIAKTYVAAIADFQKILTPEQRTMAFEMCVAAKLGKSCPKSSDCSKPDCKKCSGKICPYSKGSSKGSMKGSMQ